jgi:protein LTV1
MEEFRRDHTHRETYKTAADILEDGADRLDKSDEGGDLSSDDEDGYDDLKTLTGPAKAKEFRVTEEDVADARGAMIAMRKRAGLPLPEHLAREMTLGDGSEALGAAADDVARRYELVEEGDGVVDDSMEQVRQEIAYLNVEDRDDEWDCETSIAQYNNWENHPAELDCGPALNKPKKKKNREVKVGAEDADSGAEGAVNVIRLSDTNGLPVDYVQSRRGKGRGGNGLTAANLAAIGEGDEDDDGSDSGGEYDDEGDDFGGSEFGEDWRSNIRRKGETPEEKKARKAAVKLGRKDARAAKKGLKNTFKQEQAEMSKKRPTGDVRQGLSVRIID